MNGVLASLGRIVFRPMFFRKVGNAARKMLAILG